MHAFSKAALSSVALALSLPSMALCALTLHVSGGAMQALGPARAARSTLQHVRCTIVRLRELLGGFRIACGRCIRTAACQG